MDRFFPKEKLLLTGNPVRQEVVRLAGKRPRGMEEFGLQEGRPVLFITGGSLGARGINQGVKAALSGWKAAGIQVIWQTGTPFLATARRPWQRWIMMLAKCMSSLPAWTWPMLLPTSWYRAPGP
jgi:UDP-N-acetylglucosamine--N-acetylmuramyl-(pentapeptide) pyrophosphoryl-undecaprenol N-acetylglucosamine transferase